MIEKIKLIFNPFSDKRMVHSATFSWLGLSAFGLTVVLRSFDKIELDAMNINWLSSGLVRTVIHLYKLMIFPVAFHIGCWVFSDVTKLASMVKVFSIAMIPYALNLILYMSLLFFISAGDMEVNSSVVLFWIDSITRVWFLLLVMALLSITYDLRIGQFLLSLLTAVVGSIFVSFLETHGSFSVQ